MPATPALSPPPLPRMTTRTISVAMAPSLQKPTCNGGLNGLDSSGLRNIDALMKAAEKELEALGPPRASSEREQQAYLLKVVATFQSLVRDALSASYSYHQEAFDKHNMRLITILMIL